MDIKQGLICRLTGEKAAFENECLEFKLDEKEELRIAETEKLSADIIERIQLKYGDQIKKIWAYSDSLFLIILGIILILRSFNLEVYSPENTNFIKGVLAENPDEGRGDVAFSISEDDNIYEFEECSYNDRIASIVKELKKGDEISFYAKKNRELTFPQKRYRICAAAHPDYGSIVSFEKYNRCEKYRVETFAPILGVLSILMGIFFIWKSPGVENYKGEIDI